jgi:hypothetical protein
MKPKMSPSADDLDHRRNCASVVADHEAPGRLKALLPNLAVDRDRVLHVVLDLEGDDPAVAAELGVPGELPAFPPQLAVDRQGPGVVDAHQRGQPAVRGKLKVPRFLELTLRDDAVDPDTKHVRSGEDRRRDARAVGAGHELVHLRELAVQRADVRNRPPLLLPAPAPRVEHGASPFATATATALLHSGRRLLIARGATGVPPEDE